VATAFVVVGGISVVGSDTVGDAARDPPAVALGLGANGSTLVATHRSGDALALDDTTAVLTGADGSSERIPLLTAAADDDHLTAGERVGIPYVPPTSS
jgi:hypothetical protein